MEYQLLSAEQIVSYFVNDDPTDISYVWNAKHYYAGQSEYAIIFGSHTGYELTDLDELIGGDWRWQWSSDYDRLRRSIPK